MKQGGMGFVLCPLHGKHKVPIQYELDKMNEAIVEAIKKHLDEAH